MLKRSGNHHLILEHPGLVGRGQPEADYEQPVASQIASVTVPPMTFLPANELERDVRTCRRWRAFSGGEEVRAVVRGPVPHEWKERASARVAVEGADEDPNRVLQISNTRDGVCPGGRRGRSPTGRARNSSG